MCAYTCVYVIYIYKIFIDLYLVINSTSYATPFPRLTIKDKKKKICCFDFNYFTVDDYFLFHHKSLTDTNPKEKMLDVPVSIRNTL